MQQLDAIAQMINLSQLDERNDNDVVKCIFPLGEIDAEDAVQEVSVLNLMSTPQVLNKTNQLIITDTAAKLRNVRAVLDSFQSSEMDNGTVVKTFALQHVDAEDILLVARPHLGLATGEMIGIDVSLSADVQGKNIFVTGMEDKVKLLEGLVTAIDQPEKDLSQADGEAVLRSHTVQGGNVEIVYEVLLTLLANKPIRLSMDETASSVVALASPKVQLEIEQTIAELQASDAVFEVIQLKAIDPYLAVSLLEEMLDLADLREKASAEMEAFSRRGSSRGEPAPKLDLSVPKIDADPVNMRLFVRAKPHQMEQIKQIVEELDVNNVGTSDEIRMLPIKGSEAERLLLTAAKFWRGANPIVLDRASVSEPEHTDRVVTSETEQVALTTVRRVPMELPSQLVLTGKANSKAPAIRCLLTPRGLLLQSDDPVALDEFEEHLRTIAGPIDSIASTPIVFYLKYTKAVDALRMLAELLDGGESATEFEGGSLVNGYVTSSSSFLGSLITSRDGTTTMMAGSITVVADSRLNRLIAQGTTGDMERIESYLKIIDKDNSITAIETYGTSHVIELVNTKASEVADAIRDAYSGRVESGSGGGQPNQPGSPEAQREAAIAAKAAEGRDGRESEGSSKKAPQAKSGGRAAPSLEPKMTIAVHEPSNSLIVTAPEQLFKEVEKLAISIDQRGEQMVEVVAPINGAVFESVLQQLLLGAEASAARRTPTASSRPPSATPSRPPQSSVRGKSGR
jgi:type II secretory pathway component GspD/PulD (secretin)